jgi:hypothetical protein
MPKNGIALFSNFIQRKPFQIDVAAIKTKVPNASRLRYQSFRSSNLGSLDDWLFRWRLTISPYVRLGLPSLVLTHVVCILSHSVGVVASQSDLLAGSGTIEIALQASGWSPGLISNNILTIKSKLNTLMTERSIIRDRVQVYLVDTTYRCLDSSKTHSCHLPYCAFLQG